MHAPNTTQRRPYSTGNKIARRLASQGAHVSAWNRSADKTASLPEAGISVAGSVAAAATASDVLLLTLSDAATIRETILCDAVRPLLKGKTVLQVRSRTVGGDADGSRRGGTAGTFGRLPVGMEIKAEGRGTSMRECCSGVRPCGDVQHANLIALACRALAVGITQMGTIGKCGAATRYECVWVVYTCVC